MNPSGTEEAERRTRRRSSDSPRYSAFQTTVAPKIIQRPSAKALNEGGQKQIDAIEGKDWRYEVKSCQSDKKQGRRYSLGAYNPSLSLPRSGTLAQPSSYGTRRRHSEVLSPLSFRALRKEDELQTNQWRGQLNRTRSEENDRPQNTSLFAFKGRRNDMLSNPSAGSGTDASKTPREQTGKLTKGPRKGIQKSNPKINRSTKLSAEEKRIELDQRIKLFNQNMDQFNQNNATKSSRKLSLEKTSNTVAKTEVTPRSMSLPVVFQSYSDLDFQRLSPSEKNSFASLRHCRYLRIPAPPELTIKEIFQNINKNGVVKETKFTRK